MRPTGRRSSTRAGGAARAITLAVLLVTSGVRPVRALDVFTLWRQPNVPLRLTEGDWADYRFQVTAGGKQEQSLTRVACLDRAAGTDDQAWVVEVLPLTEESGGRLVPVPGEGLRLRLSRKVLTRSGNLLDHVLGARQWTGGRVTEMSATQLREDPLVADSFSEDFLAAVVTAGQATTRVVGGVQYLCDQSVMAAADTQTVSLPAGNLRQVTTRELTAATNPELPFLGLAYATERVRADSSLDRPGGRLRPPPARVRVEIMELVAHGTGARPVLGR
jgi:hypothetical protein